MSRLTILTFVRILEEDGDGKFVSLRLTHAINQGGC